MNITICGKYGPYPKAGGATSSYLLSSDDALVAFEFGAGALSRLCEFSSIEKLDALVLSHFHFDHCSDAGVLGYALLRLYSLGRVNKPLKVYCPKDNSPLATAIKSMKAFECVELADGDEICVKDLKFRFYSVNHPVPCLGFRVTDGKKTFAYGGDSNVCDALNDGVKDADLALLDGGLLLRDWNEKKPHLSVKHCSELSAKHGVKTIITHLNPEYTQDEITGEIILGGGDCVIAREKHTYFV